ncbi:Acetyltransferase (GNAT) domain protein [anaerobic digester metagenome]
MAVITALENINIKAWHDFVTKHPNGSIFLAPEMFFVYAQTPNYKPSVFVFNEPSTGLICGLLVAVRIKEKKGLIGRLTERSIVYGGPLTNGDTFVVKSLIEAYDKTNNREVIYTQFRNLFSMSSFLSTFEGAGYVFEDHLNIILDLTKFDGNIWDGYSSSRKRGIKKALKSNFIFRVSTEISELDNFYKLLSESYARIKLPYPHKKHFEAIFRILKPDSFKCFSLSLNGVVCASLVTLVFNKTMYGYYMGLTGNQDILKLRPSDLLFHKVFEWCVANGINMFDWMGAGKPNKEYGVRDFKLQFGGEIHNFGRYTKTHKPLLYMFGKTAIKIWKRSKL